ncbi:aminotransferase class I/II-fold pyridoxal phosphate-dependent enzyme [Candidatus Woesearchaeota archaeon]|jgi:methionine-gamma-lyase|nr:aminotransferase class I/II-fold pyridoxal phosphate-dependent enzyme [Candidatus Woesearchaeota archaeon]MBT7367675.1 aminotransferase class I/II-fold pyridoxal phosphate-dependent enzyme [Candidatus Woesearchaeota archaeon]
MSNKETKSNNKDKGFNSNAIHAGYHAKKGPVNPPIENSSTYVFESCEDGANRFASKDKEGIYSRLSNNTTRALEKKIAKLENGYDAVATASGMAAVNAVYFLNLDKYSHVVATSSIYGPSRSILEKSEFYEKWGVLSSFVDTSHLSAVGTAICPDTKLVYIETPANPTLSITDIEGVSKIIREAEKEFETKIKLVVDNTFCSPYLQTPLDFGADAVLHSMTKSIGGHADSVGGIIITKTQEDYYNYKNIIANTGGIISPLEAASFFKGVKTLGIRMDEMQKNAIIVADYLVNHPKVEWVSFPGLPNHPQYELVAKKTQMKGPGNIMCFGIKGGFCNAKKLLNNLDLITLAVSLGGVESLIQHPASMTHAGVSKEKREEAHITDDLVRFSVGIENIQDLIEDFENGFKKV